MEDAGKGAGPPSAAGNPALPPQSTATASALKPLHVQTAEGSSTGYPVRGEKQWQTWAQDLEDWGDKQTDMANTRIPYMSAV